MGLFSLFTTNSGVIESAKLKEEFERIITSLEEIEVGFKLNDDLFIFTNQRLLLVEKRKDNDISIAYKTILYSQISNFSIEAKKSFDSKAILKIWLNGQQEAVLAKEFNKSIDVYEVQKILVGHVLK